MEQLRFSDRKAWKDWLSKNHDQEVVAWLVFRKKGQGKVTFDYEGALEEALCYGWIDSLIRGVDASEYVRKFTPRKNSSVWSESNKRRVEMLITAGRMAEPGMEKIRAAKKNGHWERGVQLPDVNEAMPGALLRAFDSSPPARDNFFKLNLTCQKQYNIWINMAKRPETIEKRVSESIRLLEKGEKLGLK
ncbi:MAG: YdeI/OmpD-associated family protein [Bacteroidales bacterium]|nr:YdeI/OmpD-associated family protein [Bacteroidales bacterium]